MLYFLIILFPIISYTQNLSYLDIQCKHYCDQKHVMIQGSVFWMNETTVDEQKQFLQLEFMSNKSLHLELELNNLNNTDENQYEMPIKKIENVKSQKIQITFLCQKDELQSFELSIIDSQTQANATIPFRKQCSASYFDVGKFDLQINRSGKTTEWQKPELIDLNLETYFKVAPPQNVTLYVSNIILKLKDSSMMNKFSAINHQLTNQYVTQEKYLALTPNIACREISDEEVNFYFEITSQKLENPLIINFKIKCTSIDQEVQNNQEFPIYIGKSKTSSEIYKAGVTQQDYMAVIPENKNAFQFYIYVKGGDKEQIRQSLFPEKSKFEMTIKTTIEDDDILKIKHQNKLILKTPEEIKSVLLQFDCHQQGQTDVSVSIQFAYSMNQMKNTFFTIRKVCGPVAQKAERTILGEVIYYGICIIAMLFGVQTIRLFTNLIKQEAAVPPVSIDTSYKKGYHINEDEQQIEL